MKYVVFDTETTGLDANISQALQIAGYKIKDGITVDKFNRYIKPDLPIPYTITQINGITNEMVKGEEPESVILAEFADWLEDWDCVGHNSVGFDMFYLQTRGSKFGIDLLNGGKREGYDTLLLARKYLTIPSHRLESVRDYYNIKLEGKLHSAEYDAIITKLVFDRFLLAGYVTGEEKVNYAHEYNKFKVS